MKNNLIKESKVHNLNHLSLKNEELLPMAIHVSRVKLLTGPALP